MMSIQTAGDRFIGKLMRHHFGCEPPEPVTCQLDPIEADRPAYSEGDAFVAELLRRFSNDSLYREE